MKFAAPILERVGEPLRMVDIDLDSPKSGEVLVRLAASGVCHSCLHIMDGSLGGAPLPMVLGDEGAGIVESVGPGVESVEPGDHVIISWASACGRCRMCVLGRPVLCERQSAFGYMADGTVRMHVDGEDVHHFGVSTYAPAIVVAESCAIRIRDDMPLDRAALIGCCIPTGVGAVIYTGGVRPGQSVAVFGCGGIGLNSLQGARLVSASPIIAVDLEDKKLEAAQTFGATHTISADGRDVPAAIRTILNRGVDCAVVAAGSSLAIEQAWASLAPGGVCVVVGRVPNGVAIPINADLLVAERRLKGSIYGSVRPAEAFPWLVDAYLSGRLMIDELITQRYRLDEVNEAHRALAAGENLRGLIVF
jgi:S-(hydroxymethyl)glutathione dehydrogenase/alcohol dehydrogenase